MMTTDTEFTKSFMARCQHHAGGGGAIGAIWLRKRGRRAAARPGEHPSCIRTSQPRLPGRASRRRPAGQVAAGNVEGRRYVRKVGTLRAAWRRKAPVRTGQTRLTNDQPKRFAPVKHG